MLVSVVPFWCVKRVLGIKTVGLPTWIWQIDYGHFYGPFDNLILYDPLMCQMGVEHAGFYGQFRQLHSSLIDVFIAERSCFFAWLPCWTMPRLQVAMLGSWVARCGGNPPPKIIRSLPPWKRTHSCKLMVGRWLFLLRWSIFRGHLLFFSGKTSGSPWRMCLDATRIAGGAAGTCGGTTERWTAKNKCSTDQVPLRNMSIFGAIHCLFLDTHLWKEFFFFCRNWKKKPLDLQYSASKYYKLRLNL